MNTLYYGDNLEILRRYIKDETVDLVYLDPPFNSNATYNMLFGEQDGTQAASQIKAFEDTWKWDQAAAAAYQDTVEMGGQVSRAMQAFRTVLGENTMLAYLAMMAPRLVELRRVMKPTASIYLHCDPTASHYLKMLMDAVFGAIHFRNEVIWKRTSARSDSHRWNHIHDTLLFFSKGSSFTWNPQFTAYDEEYTTSFYNHVEEGTGRRYASDNLTASGTREGRSGEAWRGIDVKSKGLHWKYTIERLEELDSEGRILWPRKTGGVPRYKRYLDEMPGVAIQSIITDIPPLSSHSAEKLGYPTQKPQILLERIINASSNHGDVVLDPFCGCGTAVAAAQKLGRQWVGIDITHLAMTLMKHRLRDAFGKDLPFQVIGEPVSLPDAQALATSDPYQFQWWALDLVHARPVEGKKGADKGIDGRLYFHDEGAGGKTKQVIFSVKAGHTNVTHLRDLRGVLDREGAQIGVLITMEDPTKPMRTEAASAGFYDSETWGTRHPRLQILTIAELLNGKHVDMPPTRGNVTFKKAERVSKDAGQNALDI
jgi:DNA modification methylase